MTAGRPERDAGVVHAAGPRVDGPTVLRIALGGQLRQLREAAGISREDAGYAIRGSHAKISRLELGRVGFKERDVADLLTLYGVTDPDERGSFLDLARQANTPGWWHRYGDVLPSWFELYVGLESASSVIRTYQVQFVPGLLQTADYARALVRGHEPELDDAEVGRRVDLRLRRQELLLRDDAPAYWAIVDETALRRPLGGDTVLRAQLEHLLALTERPNITVQVLPLGSAGYAAANVAFTLLRFAQPDLPDIVYLEQLTSALYLDKQDDADRYRAVMGRLSVQARTPKDSAALLRDRLAAG